MFVSFPSGEKELHLTPVTSTEKNIERYSETSPQSLANLKNNLQTKLIDQSHTTKHLQKLTAPISEKIKSRKLVVFKEILQKRDLIKYINT